jgi:uncharacterized membrane protein (GlpM family)
MFKKLCLAAALATSIAFAGCVSTGGATPAVPTQAQIAAFAAAAQTKIALACTLAKPQLATVAALVPTVPTLAVISTDVGMACAASASLNTATVSDLINSAIPAAITGIAGSSLSAADQTVVKDALAAFGASLSVALAEYNLSVANGTAVSLTSVTAPKLSVKLGGAVLQ